MIWNRPAGIFVLLVAVLFSPACKEEKRSPALFETLDHTTTGLDFVNQLTPTPSFNLFNYMYFYNGAGVGAGDFNNDGLIDLFFASNQQQNKLFLNEGNLHFKDVTVAAKIPPDSGWSTGVSVVDINNDGLMDIYVCRVGKYEILDSHNQFLVCTGIDKNGVPQYADKAKEMKLDFSGFGTQAAFLDYDMDGDLDLFLLNHSVHENGTFRPRSEFLGTRHPLAGDVMYRNDGDGTFTDVTMEAGIYTSAIGYGLGVAVADINLDGYPDLYIGNDFHENDYLYINQRNGTFKETVNDHLMHTSQFSMGVDIADANNDGYPEIISMDMLPADPYILKRSLGEDAYDIFNLKLQKGYNHQYTRNNLQLNRRNGLFSEIGLYSGIAATDWSWAALWMDFDNDGLKDLFVSNGIPKRMNDIDYINYISNQEVQEKIRDNKMSEIRMSLIDKFPQIKLPNTFFANKGQLAFTDIENQVADNKPTYSNGAVYADFDNDGDLDIVVNNINDPATLYKNKSNDQIAKPFLAITLQGPVNNIHAVGSKIVLFSGGQIRLYDKSPVHGFQSSMETPVHIGLDKTPVDSMYIIWPDNTCQSLTPAKDSSRITLTWQKYLPLFDYTIITGYHINGSKPMEDITHEVKLDYLHVENPFVEFDRERLLPHMVSTEGPALAVADINHDGLEDVFIGSSKREKSAIFLQQPSGSFSRSIQPALENDSMYEDVDATWADLNNDGHTDLIVASGGNEYYGQDEHLLPRVYLNDGKAGLTRVADAFPGIYVTQSCVAPCDFNGDGYMDLFIGGRAVPWEYGKKPASWLLQNDGTGKFKEVSALYMKELAGEGLVTNAAWADLDKDKDKDLVICSEWGGITAYINDKGNFSRKLLTNKKGWWNFILPCDLNNDGHIDLVAGNLGLNSRLKASVDQPVRLYYNDFDDNDKMEQVISYYVQGKEIPFANKAEIDKQLPILKKKFLLADKFASSTMQELFTAHKLSGATMYSADYFSNAILINKGDGTFEVQEMPWQAQLSPLRDAVVLNANNDSLPDLLLAGNYYESNIEMGRYDADFGTLLLNKGNGAFTCETLNGVMAKGQTRHVCPIRIAGQEAFVLARNNDSTMVIRFRKPAHK